MAIRVGQQVRDRITGTTGIVTERREYRDMGAVVLYIGSQPFDEWRLDVVDRHVLRRFATACRRFVVSDSGTPDRFRVGFAAPCVVGVVAGYVAMFLRCHCR